MNSERATNPALALVPQPRSEPAVECPSVQPGGLSLRETVEQVVGRYLEQMDDDEAINDLYQLVMQEVEAPLLAVVLAHTSSNQSKASMLLGLNRGTLRKKMKQHGFL